MSLELRFSSCEARSLWCRFPLRGDACAAALGRGSPPGSVPGGDFNQLPGTAFRLSVVSSWTGCEDRHGSHEQEGESNQGEATGLESRHGER